MSLVEKMEVVAATLRETKEGWVASKPENTDLTIYLHFFRGEDLVATVQCPLDRDLALQACHIATAGFAASTVTFSFESYHTTLKESPVTGEPWKQHEMQFVAETVPDAADRGWVYECITTMAFDRERNYAMRSDPYHMSGEKVIWEEPLSVTPEKDDEHGDGYMYQVLSTIMGEQTIFEELAKKAKKDPLAQAMLDLVPEPERRLFHTDMATASALSERAQVMAVIFHAEPGSLRQQLLAERQGEQ